MEEKQQLASLLYQRRKRDTKVFPPLACFHFFVPTSFPLPPVCFLEADFSKPTSNKSVFNHAAAF